MKIEWVNKTKIPFSVVTPGCCILDDDNDLCLVCENGQAVILDTGEIFTPDNLDEYEVKLISAKVVVLGVM